VGSRAGRERWGRIVKVDSDRTGGVLYIGYHWVCLCG
jgi:hypothetical protein